MLHMVVYDYDLYYKGKVHFASPNHILTLHCFVEVKILQSEFPLHVKKISLKPS